MNNINNSRNNSIDIFRFICALMVIATHTDPLMDISPKLGYILTQLVPRIAVPFFFAVSGYFYIQKLEMGEKVFIKYIKRLLTTYIAWSLIYFLIDFCQWGYKNIKNYIVSSLYHFFVIGSHYHLWFFVALICSVCIVTLMFKVKLKKLLIPLSILLYLIGCLGCSYYEIGISVPILNKLFLFDSFLTIRRIFLMGFPFFTSGYLVYQLKKNVKMFDNNRKIIFFTIISIIIWLIEIFIVCNFNLENSIAITLGLYPLLIFTILLLLNNPMEKHSYFAKKCKVISNFTYYAHPLFIIIIELIFQSVFSVEITNTFLFLLTAFISIGLGYILSFSNNKYVKLIVG